MSELQNFLKSAITESKSAAGVDVAENVGKAWKKVKGIGPWMQDHMAGGKDNAVTKQLAINAKKAADEAIEKHEAGQGAIEHFKKGGKKAVAAAKDAISDHPYIAGGTAAALAAGLGAVALRKRLKKAADAKK